MSSFYGGRDGRPFIIKKAFTTIKEMVTNFKDPNYTEVAFDEYAIINTDDKNNPENGMIFRRGYGYNDNKTEIEYYTLTPEDKENISIRGYYKDKILGYGAEYVGTIVGPNGSVPYLNFTSFENVDNYKIPEEKDYKDLREISNAEDFLEALNEKYQNGIRYAANDETLMLIIKMQNMDNYFYYPNLFDPSKEKKWFPIDLTSKNTEDSITTPIDYIPTVKFDEEGNPIEWQDDIKWRWAFLRNSNNEYSIYKMGFKVPYGVHTFEAESVSSYYNRDDQDKPSKDFKNLNLIDSLPNGFEDNEDSTHPLYKKWKINIPKGIKGDTIEAIRITTSEEANIQGKPISLPKGNDSKFYVCDIINYDAKEEGEKTTYYIGEYNQIENIEFSDDGTLKIIYTYDANSEWLNKISWITGMSLANDGTLKVNFNNNTFFTDSKFEKEKLIKWIESIDVDEEGTITIEYNNGSTPFQKNNALSWFKKFNFDQNTGELEVELNFNNENVKGFNTILKTVKKLEINEKQEIVATYNTKDKNNNNEIDTISAPINFIEDLVRNEDNHILVYYSAPSARGSISYNDKKGWVDLGEAQTLNTTNFILSIPSENIENDRKNLSINGILFNTEKIEETE